MKEEVLQSFELYHTQSITEVVDALVLLSQISTRGGVMREPGTFWGLILEIQSLLPLIYGEDELYKDPLARVVLRMIDAGSVVKFCSAFETCVGLLGQDVIQDFSETSSDVQMAYSMSVEEVRTALADFVFPNRRIEEVLAIYNAYGDGQKQMTTNSLRHAHELFVTVSKQIFVISALLRITTCKSYSIDEVTHILGGDMRVFDENALVASLHNIYENGEGVALCNVYYNHLRIVDIYKKNEYTWIEALVLTIMLHQVFARFRDIYYQRQHFWLVYYFVRAMVADVPFVEYLKEDIYFETKNVVDYAIEHIFLLGSISACEEVLPLMGDDKHGVTLKDVLQTYRERSKDNTIEGYAREQYIDSLVQATSQNGFWKHVLRNILYLYTHLQFMDITEKNVASEPNDKQIFEHHLTQLLTWWITENFWSFIFLYYDTNNKDWKPVVTLSQLLGQLEKNVTLNEYGVVEKILRFQTALREQGVISSEQDIILYDESNGKFVWVYQAWNIIV